MSTIYPDFLYWLKKLTVVTHALQHYVSTLLEQDVPTMADVKILPPYSKYQKSL